MSRAWRWLSAFRRVLARSACTSSTDLDAMKKTTIYNPLTIEEINEPPSAPKVSSFERTDVQESTATTTYTERVVVVEESTYISERSVEDSTVIVIKEKEKEEEEVEEVEEVEEEEEEEEEEVLQLVSKESIAREDKAAIIIQAYFRGHLARRAIRALKSLVRLQAVVRGVCVRRQARVAIHCMQALVRLQVRVRSRQILDKSGDQVAAETLS